MTTRMISPDGGATHAYGDGDIARLEKLGWKVQTAAMLKRELEEQGWTVHEPVPATVVDQPPEQALKEVLAESMRLDPPRRGRPAKAK